MLKNIFIFFFNYKIWIKDIICFSQRNLCPWFSCPIINHVISLMITIAWYLPVCWNFLSVQIKLRKSILKPLLEEGTSHGMLALWTCSQKTWMKFSSRWVWTWVLSWIKNLISKDPFQLLVREMFLVSAYEFYYYMLRIIEYKSYYQKYDVILLLVG